MTRINQRDDDAYYDAYDEDIVAGRVKPVRTARQTNPGPASAATSSTRSSGAAPGSAPPARRLPRRPRGAGLRMPFSRGAAQGSAPPPPSRRRA